MALKENERLVCGRNGILGEVVIFTIGQFLDPEIEPLYKVPDDLGNKLKGLIIVLTFIYPKNGDIIADSGISGYGTDFPSGKSIGRKVIGQSHFRGMYGPCIHTDQMCVPEYRLCQGNIGYQFPQPIIIKKKTLHQV